MNRTVLALVLVLQVVGALFLVSEIGATILGVALLPSISWTLYEVLEITAAVALVAGSGALAVALHRAGQRTARAETALRAARGAFHEVLEERMDEWSLTPAERDVALFALKGFSGAEIAAMRGTSEGTVKAQTAAIYRKAGVNGRPQLMSLFIDEMMDGAGEAEPPRKAG